MIIQNLCNAGINYYEGLRRFAGKSELYEKHLLRFPEDDNFQNMLSAVHKGNVEAAFLAGHTLKGIAGNLSLDRFYNIIVEIVEELREGSLPKEEYIKSAKLAYDQLIAATTE